MGAALARLEAWPSSVLGQLGGLSGSCGVDHFDVALDVVVRVLVVQLRDDAQVLELELASLEDLVHLGEEGGQGLGAVQVVSELVYL